MELTSHCIWLFTSGTTKNGDMKRKIPHMLTNYTKSSPLYSFCWFFMLCGNSYLLRITAQWSDQTLVIYDDIAWQSGKLAKESGSVVKIILIGSLLHNLVKVKMCTFSSHITLPPFANIECLLWLYYCLTLLKFIYISFVGSNLIQNFKRPYIPCSEKICLIL